MTEVTGKNVLDLRHILKIKEMSCYQFFCSCLSTQNGIEKKEHCLCYRLCPAYSMGKTKVERNKNKLKTSDVSTASLQ